MYSKYITSETKITLHDSVEQTGYDKASYCDASLVIRVPQVARNAVFPPTHLAQQRKNTTFPGTLGPLDN